MVKVKPLKERGQIIELGKWLNIERANEQLKKKAKPQPYIVRRESC